MTTAAGFATRAALSLEAITSWPTWPAAAPAAATRLLPLLRANVDERALWTTHARHSHPVRQAGTITGRVSSGPMTLSGVYNGLDVVWALALGRMARRLGGSDNPEPLATGAYRHTIEVDPVMHSHAWELTSSGIQLGEASIGQQLARRATLAIDTRVSTWEFTSAMIDRLELRASPRGVTINLTWIAHALDRASAINPSLDALAEPRWHDLAFHDLEFRIAPYSINAALGSGDAISVSAMRWSLANQLGARQTEDSDLYVGEPKRRALPVMSGAFTLPRYESDTLTGWAGAKTKLMATAVFSGPEIATTGVSHELAIYLPTLTLREAGVAADGEGQLQQAYTFEATGPSAAAAGMPAVQDPQTPLIVQITDDDAANAVYTR